VNCGEVLRESAEVSVMSTICAWPRALGDCRCAGSVISSERELVEKLAHGMTKVFSLAGTGSHAGQRLA
jgi:hypothetical protein